MAELLLELFSEEIPAGMQARAATDLERLVAEGLKEAGLLFSDAKHFAGPRRLTLVIDGLPEKSPDVCEERKGPRVGSPDKAIEGFLRAAGLKSADEAEIVTDEKRGDFYLAKIERSGRSTADVIADLIPKILFDFPWQKSMRWGAPHIAHLVTEEGDRIVTETGDSIVTRTWLRWVRPLHSILCLLGGKTVSFEVDGIASGNETRGHRFMGPEAFSVKDFADYEKKLRGACVILDAEERKRLILDGARKAAKKESLELVEDEALLAENAGLVEWPVVLMGTFDESFLDVPPEVIITAIKKHQKCFSLRKDKEGKLANNFILVSNLVAEDGGAAITDGNRRVIRARLSDAKFFWDQDRQVPLEKRLPELGGVIFHEKLGTQAERVERLKKLARELAPVVGADPDKAERAAALCKADLVTGMVGEFPDLQGLMGKYYAREQGEDDSVARAIEEHYRPLGPSDAVPTDPVSIAVALADKLDTLVGFWAIDEKPTGSKDPYALRRAALGVIRIVLENGLQMNLNRITAFSARAHYEGPALRTKTDLDTVGLYQDLLGFFADRLKIYLRDRGARHDLIDAVFSLGGQDDLLMIVARVEALGKFLATDDGANLLTGVDRATSIIRIEEKKDKTTYDGAPDPKLFQQDEEKALAKAIDEAAKAAGAAVDREDFEGAMRAMAKLRSPVDAFFDHVTVNADDPKLRENRLKLLNRIREATLAVADFSKIAG